MKTHRWNVRLIGPVVVICGVCAWGQTTRESATRPAPKFGSLAELHGFYRDKLDQSRRAIEAERFAALEQFVRTASADEKRAARHSLIESAMFLERFDQVLSLTEAFLNDYPGDPETWSVRGRRLIALIEKDRLDQARDEWDKASETIDMQAWEPMLSAGMTVAEGFADAGRANDVRAIYEIFRKRFSFVTNLNEVLGPKTKDLDWVGRAPPALEGKDLAGGEVDLSAYRGKVVLIDFWATWCQPCLMALPDLKATYEAHHKAGFELIGISLDDDKDALDRFMKRHQLPWRILYDGRAWQGANARKFDVTGIPAAFLIDRNGKIARVGAPARGFEPVVRRLLAAPVDKPEKP